MIPFGDLRRHYAANDALYDSAIARVVASGWYILGNELEAFEREFADYCRVPHCIGCNSGTDAIQLALQAHGIGPGNRVITVPNTCVPTAAGIGGTGAEIGLCDVDASTGLMDADALDAELNRRQAQAVVAVHLYGQPADIDALRRVAEGHHAVFIEDAAQAHGATYKGGRIGSHGNTVCWSFYPSKNLGAFGDAGAVTTHSPEMAKHLRMLRNYGQERRYHHTIRGSNSRLDEIQAAILREKLTLLDEWNERRRAIAVRYTEAFSAKGIRMVARGHDRESCEHLFVIRHAHRDKLIEDLRAGGIECLIHYPVPIHLQAAYEDLRLPRGSFPHAEALCDSVVSLPMYPELTDDEVATIIETVCRCA